MSLVKISISINHREEAFPFLPDYIRINENYHNHHSFEITGVIPNDVDFELENVKEMLGEMISIDLKNEETGDDHKFVGLVDSATPYFLKSNRMLKIAGYSPTILMDSGFSFRVFNQQTIKEVADVVLKNHSNHISFAQIQNGNLPVGFKIQNQESDFRFLARLADDMGLNFFYDGEQVQFRKIAENDEPSISLELQSDIQNLEANINLCPLKFLVKAYNSQSDSIENHNKMDSYTSNNQLVKCAIEKSKCYTPSKVGLNYSIVDSKEMESQQKQIISRQTNELVSFSGRSNHTGLKIGSIIHIDTNGNSFLGLSKEDPLVVIQVNHQVDEHRNYYNAFVAIPADHPFPVNIPNTKTPICGPLTAIVKENADPDNLGRVKVQFLMDDEKNLSPWIKVLTPFAANNGFYFLPEKDEKVIVFFEDFNPEKAPFVMGSFFTPSQNATHWNNSENRKKGIYTKNISFDFDDESGELTIKAKKIKLEADQEIEMDGGNSIKQKANRIDLN